jgi:hypothetical protein
MDRGNFDFEPATPNSDTGFLERITTIKNWNGYSIKSGNPKHMRFLTGKSMKK